MIDDETYDKIRGELLEIEAELTDTRRTIVDELHRMDKYINEKIENIDRLVEE